MKKYNCLILSLFLLCSTIIGCSAPSSAGSTTSDTPDAPLHIVTTIFPIYDWVREILGDRLDTVQLDLLLDSGVDLHSIQPTAADIIHISTCDVFLYVGGESDEWVQDALKESVNPNRLDLSLLDALGDAVKEEEAVEGMETEDDKNEEAHDEDETEYDEHVWLSLRNASVLCDMIADALAKADPASAETFRKNADVYTAKLRALDDAYSNAVSAAPYKTLLFGDRFPFRYLVDDYGLTYYAAFSGCSAETESSFETIVFLAGKLDELGLPAIAQIESSDGSIAETIRKASAAKDQQIVTFDSLQSVTAQDVAAGASYLERMEHNFAILQTALGITVD